MEAIDVGWLSILPPIIAISLALVTKEVISSLIIGILSGAFIYAINTGGGIIKAIDITIQLMAEKMSGNVTIILFLAFLGALVAVVTMAGGSRAYGEWAASKIKTRAGAQLATSALGAVIFIDDYFNCLTVGTVMQPVTDKHNISRAKLAYIIDATAAPMCIIAPISSWAASVISQLNDVGLNGMETFMKIIPYNFYAILTLIMVLFLSATNFEFGPMKKFGDSSIKENIKNTALTNDEQISRLPVSDIGRVVDLVVPLVALIVFCTLAMLYIGGYFEGEMTLTEGFGNTDAGLSLAIGGFSALFVTFIFYIPRKVLKFTEFMEGINTGVKTMVPAYIILTLAWTIGGVCSTLLSTGPFVGQLVKQANMSPVFIPAIIFIVAGFLAFSTGTSWGTFGILIPIVATVMQSMSPELMIIALSATLAGAVLGDHCSPISDTTILSSTGSGCNHIDHVSTQIPYVILVGICSILGYLIAGYTLNFYISFGVSLIVMLIMLTILGRNKDMN
ncbi:sodium:proton antiporter [Candidatus Epulonipiscium fishelsonii]|uniref:Sodium:proton antiporter n=1 Tax=Candidatus Epulonipiscium fishelsonii TaxID=77094 RepID=A0ACC8XJI7_9FIRM|nr:sodium:proton antiporter [Epulopiscium sp. SCG-D08WGA-EpuloA1]OON92824.1 MAG: sodium:proton antiporter [Epulopiscium sp. AS2M-Bin002]